MVFTVPWYVDRRDGKIIKKKHIKHRTVGLIEYWNRMMGSTLTFFWAVYTAKASRSRPYPMRMKIWIPVFRTDRRYSPGVRPHLVGVIASGSQAPSLLHQVPRNLWMGGHPDLSKMQRTILMGSARIALIISMELMCLAWTEFLGKKNYRSTLQIMPDHAWTHK